MATFDAEREDAALQDEGHAPAPGPWNRPLLLAGLGLVLMLLGYAATTYTPTTAHQAEQERRLADLRRKAAQRQAEGVEDGLPERLQRVTAPAGSAPFHLVGRLAVYGGLFLFVTAGVVMYRSSPPSPKDSDELQ